MKRLLLALALPFVFATTGCDDSDGDFSHKPPAGQGSLIVDNRTAAKFEVYIDGVKLARVATFDDRAFDLKPGVHRVIVDEDDGRRGDARDVCCARLGSRRISRLATTSTSTSTSTTKGTPT